LRKGFSDTNTTITTLVAATLAATVGVAHAAGTASLAAAGYAENFDSMGTGSAHRSPRQTWLHTARGSRTRHESGSPSPSNPPVTGFTLRIGRERLASSETVAEPAQHLCEGWIMAEGYSGCSVTRR
jgi:hypothetical protein